MLTPGNAKLGTDLIWGFGLPSGGRECVGMSKRCRDVCYARRTEQYRPQAAKRYRRNLALSKTKGFVRRVRAFLIAHHVRVVRIHTGGEFHNRKYVRKWWKIVARSPRVKFFTYTRAWRIPAFRPELERLAGLPNCQLWYSADRETGLPDSVPERVRVAWLMTEPDDLPPAATSSTSAKESIDLIFRVRTLRRLPRAEWHGIPVCPAEAGLPGPKPTCDHCRLCWKPPVEVPREPNDESPPEPRRQRSLPLVLTPHRGGLCSP